MRANDTEVSARLPASATLEVALANGHALLRTVVAIRANAGGKHCGTRIRTWTSAAVGVSTVPAVAVSIIIYGRPI
jgi:hypothetical protein